MSLSELQSTFIHGESQSHVDTMDYEMNYVESGDRSNLRRRVEDVDYWMKQAGWYTDDASYTGYNANYNGGNSGGGGSSGGSNSSRYVDGGNRKPELSTGLKITAAIISIVIAMVVFRVLSRRSSKKKISLSSKHGSDSRSMRSRSRSRSGRSRSRTRRSGQAGSNYELMDDKSDSRSRKSGRSRSRSRRSRSKSKSRSSKTRSKSKTRSSRTQEQVLV